MKILPLAKLETVGLETLVDFRAALALTEAVTRIADRPDPVPDQVWEEAAHHYTEPQLAALLVSIANINAWNRLNVATRQPSGDWVEHIIQGARGPA